MMKLVSLVVMMVLMANSTMTLANDSLVKELPEAESIMKKFDALPYATEGDSIEAVGEIPFCEAVIRRQQNESREMLQAALKDKPILLSRLQEFTGTSRQTPKKVENPDGKRPTYFLSSTEVQALVQGSDKGGYSDKVIPIEELKVGDYVLSTTATFTEDKRYQQRCWAPVSAKHSGKITANNAMKVILYENKTKTSLSILTTGDPKLTLFAEVVEENRMTFKPTLCADLKLGNVLLSPNEQGIEGKCLFAANFSPQTVGEQTAYNLDVDITGTYFVGPLGGQILVQD